MIKDEMEAAKTRLMKTIATCGYGTHIVDKFVINNELPDEGRFDKRSKSALNVSCEYKIEFILLKKRGRDADCIFI